MGIVSRVFGIGAHADEIGGAIERVAEVFIPNKTKEMDRQHQEFTAALAQHGAEFQQPQSGLFNSIVNGLNRLPRPVLALGTVALFVYAMLNPAGFTLRMQGLAHVPDPLWWLLGAVVSFYFGARELHYLRDGRRAVQAMSSPGDVARATSSFAATPPPAAAVLAKDEAAQHDPETSASANPALDEWRRSRGDSG